ncbi:hypothetical protein G9A89_020167 [Geosiphon pyriformis]|nr:hypothetical protein G9A89_020167 [Geosiphon pyriformis]
MKRTSWFNSKATEKMTSEKILTNANVTAPLSTTFTGFSQYWSKEKKAKTTAEHHKNLALSIKDIILGAEYVSHSKQQHKRALKALQKPSMAQSILNVLKAMPQPELPKVEVVTHLSTSAAQAGSIDLNDKKSEPLKDKLQTIVEKEIVKVIKPSAHEISAYTYWWGYEIYVPQECMGRLDQAQSVGTSFLGFLQVVAGNVGSLHPYFGFISAWVGLQFTLIKSQNAGKGVVLAATWVLPVALIPRAWDVST